MYLLRRIDDVLVHRNNTNGCRDFFQRTESFAGPLTAHRTGFRSLTVAGSGRESNFATRSRRFSAYVTLKDLIQATTKCCIATPAGSHRGLHRATNG